MRRRSRRESRAEPGRRGRPSSMSCSAGCSGCSSISGSPINVSTTSRTSRRPSRPRGSSCTTPLRLWTACMTSSMPGTSATFARPIRHSPRGKFGHGLRSSMGAGKSTGQSQDRRGCGSSRSRRPNSPYRRRGQEVPAGGGRGQFPSGPRCRRQCRCCSQFRSTRVCTFIPSNRTAARGPRSGRGGIECLSHCEIQHRVQRAAGGGIDRGVVVQRLQHRDRRSLTEDIVDTRGQRQSAR